MVIVRQNVRCVASDLRRSCWIVTIQEKKMFQAVRCGARAAGARVSRPWCGFDGLVERASRRLLEETRC